MAHPPLREVSVAARGRVIVYVLGPGVGECQVVLLPDGRVLVVDACMDGDRNLGVELLRALGITKVDLFVVTHPDKDHVRGAAGMLQAFPPEKLWIYPVYASLRSVLVKAKRLAAQEGSATSEAFKDLSAFLEQVELFPRRQREEVRGRRAPWTFAGGGYEVHPIAPSSPDEVHEAELLWEKVSADVSPSKSGRFVQWVEDFVERGHRPKDHPNALSVALSIAHGDRRVLLAGDVERCDEDSERGWSGVLRELHDPSANRAHLIRGLSAIKVAHHGSAGAVHAGAWQEHRAHGVTPIGVIAPYANTPLPREDGLTALREQCTKLAITRTTARARSDATTAGWHEVTSGAKQPEDFPMVAVEIPQAGPVEVSVWGDASVWEG